MIKFDVPDMSCAHCKAAIEKSITALDPSAIIDIDLAARVVTVQSNQSEERLKTAIAEAGYGVTSITLS